MNKFSPIVGIVKTVNYFRYFEYALKQLNINFKVIDFSEIENFEYVISNTISNSANDIEQNHSGFVVTLARSKHGQLVVYPVSSYRKEELIVPALNLSESDASYLQSEAIKLATQKQLEGICEFVFSTNKNELIKINDFPTQLSLWTIDGCVTSIFENQVRAILNLPLGSPKLLTEKVVSVNILAGQYFDMYRPFLHIFARDPELKVHLYDKQFKVNEILGHVCVKGNNLDDLLERAHHAADYFNGAITE